MILSIAAYVDNDSPGPCVVDTTGRREGVLEYGKGGTSRTDNFDGRLFSDFYFDTGNN
jgi:hypothetical protein